MKKIQVVIDTEFIRLQFNYDREFIQLVKAFPGSYWMASERNWVIPFLKETLDQINQRFEGRAELHYTDQRLLPIEKEIKQDSHNRKREKSLDEFKSYLLSKRYSENTIKTYVEALDCFFTFFQEKAIEELDHKDLVFFNNQYILARGYSASYQNQVINAVKLYYSKFSNQNMEIDFLHRPRREKRLPNVLSKQEVRSILEAPVNLKHRAMLSLIYGCGLRRSELLGLKPQDIQSDRNLLFVRQSKGKKDRVVPLSDKLIELVRAYYKAYKPKIWLFEGQESGEKYSERSIQLVLKQALSKTNIQKPVSLHWLRHSYATHLLESGTDLRYIQEILGHSSSKTTEIYTHVSQKNIKLIRSPFDDL